MNRDITLTGKGYLNGRGFERPIEIDLTFKITNNGCFLEGNLKSSDYSIGLFNEIKLDYHRLELKNIILANSKWILKSDELARISMKTFKGKNCSIEFSTSKNIYEFKSNLKLERVHYNNYLIKRRVCLNIENHIIDANDINGRIRIWNDKGQLNQSLIKKIELAIELIQGQKLHKNFEENEKGNGKFYTENIKRENKDLMIWDLCALKFSIEKIVKFLKKLDLETFKKWEKLINHLVIARGSGYIDLLQQRFSILEIFKEEIEVWDKNKRVYVKRVEYFRELLKRLLRISDSEANFILQIRNDSVHEAEELTKSIKKHEEKLKDTDNLYQLLKKTDDYSKKGFLVYCEIDRMINIFIARKMELTDKAFKENESDIEDYEKFEKQDYFEKIKISEGEGGNFLKDFDFIYNRLLN